MTRIVVEKSVGRNDAYRLEISGLANVLRVAKAMYPFCAKKAEDLRIAIDYLEDRITGDQAIGRLNQEVISLRRAGIIRKFSLPFTRSQGTRVKQLENAKKARAAYAVNIQADVQEKIMNDHARLGLGTIRLSKKYGYSQSVIRRVLGRR